MLLLREDINSVLLTNMNKEEIIKRLIDKDDKLAYEYAKKISIESSKTNKYLDMIPDFASMLQDKSSFVRARFFILICNQARWANDGQIQNVYKHMEQLLSDSKPTVVRQCLNALHEVALFRPEMCKTIKKTISKIDLSIYKDSMQPLIKKDIDELMKRVDD